MDRRGGVERVLCERREGAVEDGGHRGRRGFEERGEREISGRGEMQ